MGELPSTNRLPLAIGLPLRNQDALSALLRQIYDPASPQYHQYLTPAQFAEQFGPTEADYQTVINFASANGLAVTGTHPNRTLLDVVGSVADVEKTFHVTLRVYRHPVENRNFYAPDVEPSLDLTVPVLAINGLNNYHLPRPLYRQRPGSQALLSPSLSGSGPSGSYWGRDFRNAYAPGAPQTGIGQTVALFECDGYFASDIAEYVSQAGLPSVPLSNVLIDGYSGIPFVGDGGNVEVALDIEMAISMAPGLSQILVYEGATDNATVEKDILNRIATDNLAKQISSSWVLFPSQQNDQIYQQFIAQGQSFFQACGDEDAYYPGIFQYQDSAYVTLVGGTTLTMTSTGVAWFAETVWNWGGGEGTGGGISTNVPIPVWQQGVSMTANQGSTTLRNIPDVALTANGVYVVADDGRGYGDVGGTSCAAPLWAGFTALINQQGAANGKSPVGFLNPAIYTIGTGTTYTACFHDITTGNNESPESPTKFLAVTGYDLCTGWGTPNGTNLINALVVPNQLTVSAPTNASAGVLTGAGTVSVTVAPSANLTVTLSSTPATLISVPPTVTIPAGNTNVTFTITVLDDGILDGTQTATITASAASYISGSASMQIYDSETATLTLAIPATALEDQGVLVNGGTLFVSAPPGENVLVNMGSGNTNAVLIPSSVTIPAGQTSAVFNVTVVNHDAITGPIPVTVTAQEQNWTGASATITVYADTNVTVNVPAQVSESAGVLTNGGSIVLQGVLTTNLVLSLASSNPSRLAVPATVTIPAGQSTALFNLTLIPEGFADSNYVVSVTASAGGLANGTGTITILNSYPDHFAISAIPSPQTSSVPFTVTVTAQDVTNQPVPGFIGTVSVSAVGSSGALLITPANSLPFVNGQWTGNLTVNSWDPNVVVTVSDGNGDTGSSNPFPVLRPSGAVFISVTNRVDMVEDTSRGVLYITAVDRVLRYNLANGTFLSPYIFGSHLTGIDISPDNSKLVVADTAYTTTNVWVYVVDLTSGTSTQILFTSAASEAGTYAVAFGNDGAALITSTSLGSGTAPMRRFNPADGSVSIVSNPGRSSMVNASGDGHVIGVAEANLSSGPLDRYDVTSQVISGAVNAGTFTFEIGVNRDGTQLATPTYGGTFVYDSNLTEVATLGSPGSQGPIGQAYDPQADLVFFAWWPANYVSAFETHTWVEVARYACGYTFPWVGNLAFQEGRVRSARDGSGVLVTVGGGLRWISLPVGPPADLGVTASGSANPVFVASDLSYSIVATNNGPNDAAAAEVVDRLPATVNFVSASTSQGICTQSNGVVTCNLGTLTDGSGAQINITVVPQVPGVLTNVTAILSSALDSNSANNAATVITTVLGIGVLGVASSTNICAIIPGADSSGVAFGNVMGGQVYAYQASGCIQRDYNQNFADPNGDISTNDCALFYANDWIAPSSYTCPGLYSFSLVGKVNGECIQLGTNGSFTAPSSGTLVLYFNDDNYLDNAGTFSACVGIPATFTSTGSAGGPFTPASQMYTLTNSGTVALIWVATNTQSWLSLSAANGTLAAGAGTNVTASINSNADVLAVGNYSDAISFTNLSYGIGSTNLPVNLTVNPGAILGVSPSTGLTSTGNNGGPFSPASQVYTLTNSGGAILSWSAANTQNWLSLSATNGTLAAGAWTTVTVSINANANSLAPGAYSDTVAFINLTNGIGNVALPIGLTVNAASILGITPSTGLNSSGYVGGPFSPASQAYTLTNSGGAALSWSAGNSQPWLSLSASSGTLAVGAGTTVTVSINPNANSLAIGSYSDAVVFTNLTTGLGNASRSVSLTVKGIPVLSVSPATGLNSTGPPGGPFNPSS
ncbi:MAG: protease pro-enzyme activation domain-containing protein, partial [Verrucomicrobiia bacterium]